MVERVFGVFSLPPLSTPPSLPPTSLSHTRTHRSWPSSGAGANRRLLDFAALRRGTNRASV